MLAKEIGAFSKLNKFDETEYYEGMEKLLKGIDAEIVPILKKCLAYDPESRYESLTELKNDMNRRIPLDSILFNENLVSETCIYVDYHDEIHLAIRDFQNYDLDGIITILKENFPIHNVFSKSRKDVAEYIRNSDQSFRENGGGFLVCQIDDKVEGVMLLRINDIDRINGHIRVTYNHFTTSEGFDNPDVTQYMICAADRKLEDIMRLNNLKTAKVAINLAPYELGLKPVLEDIGFVGEGTVRWKYRADEDVMMLGKSVDKR